MYTFSGGQLMRMNDASSLGARAAPTEVAAHAQPPAASFASSWSLRECCQVFGGEFTADSDKEKLVEPVLGLWAMVLSGYNSGAYSAQVQEVHDAVMQIGLETTFPTKHFGEVRCSLGWLVCVALLMCGAVGYEALIV